MAQAVMRIPPPGGPDGPPEGPAHRGPPAKATVRGAPAQRDFVLPSLVYVLTAAGYAVFLLGEIFRVAQGLRQAAEADDVLADGLSHLGVLTLGAGLVFGGCFGRPLPGWPRIALVGCGAILTVVVTSTHGAY